MSSAKPWRVYRFEAPDGRYAELATNELAPEQIQLPPHAAEYRFVRSTEMAPRAEVGRLEEALRRILDLRDTEWATDPSHMDQRFVAQHYARKLEQAWAIAAVTQGEGE